MNSAPLLRMARDVVIRQRLEQQAREFRRHTAEARHELNKVLASIIKLRRNPLGRPFLNGALIETVRKAKSLLSREVVFSVPDETDDDPQKPRGFAMSAADVAAMTPEQATLMGRVVAMLVEQNLDIPHDPAVAAVSTGSLSKEIFTYVGAEWLALMIRHGRLAPSHAVLDIGCGCGRMAGPLTMYLDANGSYRGFDPVKESIDHARTYLGLANFHFQFVDLHHYLYNPGGVIDPSTFLFPREDSSIDVALAGSIFTHLDLDTAQHYLHETLRVLRPGGRAVYSLFAMVGDMVAPPGSVTRPLGTGDGPGMFRFLNRGGGYYTHCDEQGNPKNHYMSDPVGDPVAFDQEAFISMASKAGLIVESCLPGGWCGREYIHGYQDMLVLKKPACPEDCHA